MSNIDIGKAISNIGQSISRALTPKGPGIIETAQTINSTIWREIAANAWAYFQPGTGVDPNTGLPYASGSDFTSFTDWDLGVYIQSVLDAQKLNLTTAFGCLFPVG